MDTNRLKGKVAPAVAAAIILFLPLVVKDRFLIATLIESGTWCVFALGFAAVFKVGQMSMGQAAFMAIGGYTAALLSIRFGTPLGVTLLAGGVAAGLVALLLGMVVLRIGDLYFAIATLAFGEITTIIAKSWLTVTKGSSGLALYPPEDFKIAGMTVSFGGSALPFYYLIVAVVAVTALVFWRIDRSRLGRITTSVAMSGVLSEHLGMHLMKHRVIMFTLAAFFTGVGGAFYAHYLLWVGPPLYGSAQSFAVLMMCVLGGLYSSVAGPILGAVLLTLLGAYLSVVLEGLRPLVYGLMIIGVVWLLPNGLVDLRRLVPLWTRRLHR